MDNKIKTQIIECPRDAMQGIKTFIPTSVKTGYMQQLLACGFHTLDCGSFVSAKAIPQMKDTAEVISTLDLSKTDTKLLVIIANERGATDACKFDKITYLGYPFSVSEVFQQRNTNASILQSLERLTNINKIAIANNKKMVVYISMGFGNPYGEKWNYELVEYWVQKIVDLGITIISLSDTVGTAQATDVDYVFKTIIPKFPQVTFGAHFHAHPAYWKQKTEAAYNAGCRRFDGALMGLGGCPMAKDDLVGNIATENLIEIFDTPHIDNKEINKAMEMAHSVFNS